LVVLIVGCIVLDRFYDPTAKRWLGRRLGLGRRQVERSDALNSALVPPNR
jgi:hypothetical protein